MTQEHESLFAKWLLENKIQGEAEKKLRSLLEDIEYEAYADGKAGGWSEASEHFGEYNG